MDFASPLWLLLLLGLVLPWLVLRHKGFLGYSDVRLLKHGRRSRFLHKVPAALLCLSYIALVAALAQPQQAFQKPTGHVLARDVVFGIDYSGSMTTPFQGRMPAPNAECTQQLGNLPAGALKQYEQQQNSSGVSGIDPSGTREAAAAGAVENFICQSYLTNSGDRIGLLEFSDSPTWLWPLTTDLRLPFRQAEFIPYAQGGGTNFGEQPPGPIDFGARMFQQIGQSKSRVFILVTDGEDTLGPDVVARLVNVIRANHIHFYVIGVAENLLADNADIAKVATETGGTVFMAQTQQGLNNAVQTVDRLTRSPVQVQTSTQHNELFWYFAYAFLALFVLGMAGEAIVLSR